MKIGESCSSSRAARDVDLDLQDQLLSAAITKASIRSSCSDSCRSAAGELKSSAAIKTAGHRNDRHYIINNKPSNFKQIQQQQSGADSSADKNQSRRRRRRRRRSGSYPFAYYMLVALEGGSLFRALLLLLLSPLLRLLFALSPSIAIRSLIFFSVAGLHASHVESIGRSVLCRFYLQDLLQRRSLTALLRRRRRRPLWGVSSTPRPMVEPFLKEFLGVRNVIATELHTVGGVCTGLVTGAAPGSLLEAKKREALIMAAAAGGIDVVQVQGAAAEEDFRYITNHGEEATTEVDAAPEVASEEEPAMEEEEDMEEYPKELIFHDGRLVQRPTELMTLFLLLWLPIGILLAMARMAAWVVLPRAAALPALALLGVRVRVKGAPPPPPPPSPSPPPPTLYVCTHKTVVDGMMCSIATRKKLAAAIYSVSRVVEALSSMTAVRLTRDRTRDAEILRRVLHEQRQDLLICPEGTTCREPYLLRFSPLFAELTHRIVPVGMDVRQSLFYGNTASGNKILDPTFFFMNPFPLYSVHILDPLPEQMTAGMSSTEVANAVQKLLGTAMGYCCTKLTRKHKYVFLAGNDGSERRRQTGTQI